MLACILIKPGVLEIKEIPTPRPAKGEVLIKVKASLTCGTDVKAFLRGHPVIPMPGQFGHEFSGIVAEVGKGVRGFREGDDVMAVHTAPCFRCAYCKKRAYNLCETIMETKVLGAFAEYLLLPSHVVKTNLFRKPAHLSFKEAALLEPLSCVIHSVKPFNIKRGDSAMIVGAGPIGLLHLFLLKRKKARVAVADIKNERLTLAKRLGTDLVFRTDRITHSPSPAPLPSREGNNTEKVPSHFLGKRKPVLPSPRLRRVGEGKVGIDSYRGKGYILIKKFTDGIGFDYVFECTGKPEVWEASVNYLRKGGTLILFGGCEKGTKVTYDTYRLHYDEITIKGSFHYTPEDVKKAYKLLSTERLKLSQLISKTYSLRDIERAFTSLVRGEGIKYAIIP